MNTVRTFAAGFALFATAIGIGGFALAHSVSANTTNSRESLIERIASKFNLNQSDVENVFNEERDARQANRISALDARLSKAVTDGTITNDQKNLILQKMKDLQSERNTNAASWSSKTPAERRAELQKERDDFEAWLKNNNIPSNLFPRFGMMHGMGWFHRGMR